VDDCVYQVFIFDIRCIVWVELNESVEGFLGLRHFPQRQIRLEKPLVDPWEFCIDSDASLTIFHSLPVLLEGNITRGPVGQDLLRWLYLARFRV
jgi:hypothetical protein